MYGSYVIVALTVAVSLVAAVTDVRWGKIPNVLTYIAMLAGLLLQTVEHGARGLLFSLAGGVLFGGVFLLLYLVRAMGAGDVKLATALGCIVGVAASIQLMLAVAIAGGVLAVLHMLFKGRTAETLRNAMSVVRFHARHGLQPHPVANLQNPAAARMPYALAAAGGTLYWAIFLSHVR